MFKRNKPDLTILIESKIDDKQIDSRTEVSGIASPAEIMQIFIQTAKCVVEERGFEFEDLMSEIMLKTDIIDMGKLTHYAYMNDEKFAKFVDERKKDEKRNTTK